MIPCLPSEVLAVPFYLSFVAELTASNSNREKSEVLLTGKKRDLF